MLFFISTTEFIKVISNSNICLYHTSLEHALLLTNRKMKRMKSKRLQKAKKMSKR
ncbi:hypothetical protein [Sulfolobus tengchongensis spindle-shaped virus 4]|nr:hypothetical protein [Sulfolobus tengchongensis spindle-shaped virus 4]